MVPGKHAKGHQDSSSNRIHGGSATVKQRSRRTERGAAESKGVDRLLPPPSPAAGSRDGAGRRWRLFFFFRRGNSPRLLLSIGILCWGLLVLAGSARETGSSSLVWSGRQTTKKPAPAPFEVVFAEGMWPTAEPLGGPSGQLSTRGARKSDGGIRHPLRPQDAATDEAVAISRRDERLFEKERKAFLAGIDEPYENKKYQPLESLEDEPQRCRRANWAGYAFPTCNEVHARVIDSLDDDGFVVSYLNSGSYRDAYRFRRELPGGRDDEDHFVLKRTRLRNDFGLEDLEKVHREALVMERLTHSPRILAVHAHCGASVFVEAMEGDLHTKIIPGYPDAGYASQESLDVLPVLRPRNDFTPPQKLGIARAMAESLADLHGFAGGQIRHRDTHIEQWLVAFDGSIKLNDFNNAMDPSWDPQKKRYCLRSSTYGGTYRSPEEFSGNHQDESVDTFALGNNIYTLLTGLFPFYDEEFREVSHDDIEDEIIAGKRPFVDDRYRTRSYIEGKLVDIMEQTWAQRRQDRPSIFEVVDFLRKAEAKARKRGLIEPSEDIRILPLPS